MKGHLVPLALALFTASSGLLVAAQGTQWSKIDSTDSFGADVQPEGYPGSVDPANAEEECKTWCLSVATCTMFLYYTDTSGLCLIKTGKVTEVAYQYSPTARWNLVLRDIDCGTALDLTGAYLESGEQGPACTQSVGNTDDGTDDIPQGSLNAECLADNTCLNGNVCDINNNNVGICKAPLGGNCRELSDCSNTIVDPDLQCTLEGGTDGNRICAAVAAAPPPGASQAVERKKRRIMRAILLRSLTSQCPKETIACSTLPQNNVECVNPNEELAHCGACGNDCQQIEGVHQTGVMCSSGRCLIYRCRKGFKVVGNKCVLHKQAKAI